ncbi:MAG: hypothetical protein M0Q95_14125 [Porticoccaceae bacterium]|nr:hypothetical protein [Porticoccaceae bacterium]
MTAQNRENVGRIDHIILIYKNRENQRKAKQQFSETLKIDDWHEIGEAPEGLSIVISWQSGIELVYPTTDNPAYQQHLEKYGEGFYAMVFGVADLDESVAHIENVSGKKPFILKTTPAPVYEKFDIAREAVVGSLGGSKLLLSEFRKK